MQKKNGVKKCILFYYVGCEYELSLRAGSGYLVRDGSGSTTLCLSKQRAGILQTR